MSKEKREKILIIGPAWVGDMIMSQSLYRVLKAKNPDCQITVMAPDWVTPLLGFMPEVDESLTSPLMHGDLKLGLRRSIGLSLKERAFTKSIILPQSFKSALIPWHSGISERVGWRGEWRNLLLTDCRKPMDNVYPLMVQRFVALAYPANSEPLEDFPHPELRVIEAEALKISSSFDLTISDKILAICPGAEFGEAKQWPVSHFAQLANLVLKQDWQVWIFGSANDSKVAREILFAIEDNFANQVSNLVGKTSLAQAADLMSLTSVVVSNDSGLMHVAAALSKPVVGLYGSTSPEFTPPLAENTKLFSTDIECRPCFKRECRYGHLRCLKEIKAEEVTEAVTSLNFR